MRILFLCLTFALYLTPGRCVEGTVDQGTLLGQIGLAEMERGSTNAGDTLLETHRRHFIDNNGSPCLNKFDIQLGRIMRNELLGGAMSILMALAIGGTVVHYMRERKPLGNLAGDLAVKFLIGIIVFHMPSMVYSVGMTVRDLGTYLATQAFSTQRGPGPTLSRLSLIAAPQTLDFEQMRAESIDRAVRDLGQPANGFGAAVAYDLYLQLAARADSLSGKASTSASTAALDPTLVEKQRQITANLSRVLQILAGKETGDTFTYTAYRVGPAGGPDKTSGVDGGAHKLIGYFNGTNQSAGLIEFYDSKINASQVTLETYTFQWFFRSAVQIRQEFETKTAKAAFVSTAEYTEASRVALENYGNIVYRQTCNYIKYTFWTTLAFSCGEAGGNEWSHISKFSKDDRTRVSAAQEKLRTWYASTTGRAVSSVSAAPAAEQKAKATSKVVIEWMGFFRDKTIAWAATMVFDFIIEIYVFLIWLTYPLWFLESTKKAFTGALNIFVVACLTPAVFTFLFVLWDAFIGFAIYFTCGGSLLELGKVAS